jgi:hypothetical protein
VGSSGGSGGSGGRDRSGSGNDFTYGFKSNNRIRYILFLDSDEVVEGGRFHNFLLGGGHLPYRAMSFECYWYFRRYSTAHTAHTMLIH